MTVYEMRAQHIPADPVGRRTVRWHIVRLRHLVGLCGQLIDPISESRSIGEAVAVASPLRCPSCWDWWRVAREADSAHR